MTPGERDLAYLWDMLDAARAIAEFVRGIDQEAYRENRMMQLAVERCLQVIGEAAKKVFEPVKAARPEIPWQKIVSQRNVLAHEYGAINQDRLWRVAASDIPSLIEHLSSLVPDAPQG
jgi:uncharacterized protein with HEPN domain